MPITSRGQGPVLARKLLFARVARPTIAAVIGRYARPVSIGE
jgi:hypothetical protein